MIEDFIQGNVHPYQQRIKELDAENERLKERHWVDTGAIGVCHDEIASLKAENERLRQEEVIAKHAYEVRGLFLKAAIKRAEAAEERASSLKKALEKNAALVAALCDDDKRTVKFTGIWSHLGTTTVGEVLDEAEAALTPDKEKSDV
ncbi:hypothetical protein DC522_05710 [Microvirga sp. KLBC 81]|uniref:hypothetical protein n=1 Tax=Microvirga sp. KLBC 81 TaxID=1862707 RepID=UPI000D51B3DB|nr:hypothetical protein [Microvirga sp. KLBC 81]PVE25393.1 hypothetical protein DC522_05710 [Microvirga sp. KLBC 81]